MADTGLVTPQRAEILVRDPAVLPDLAEGGDLAVTTGGHHPGQPR